jgi:hypothetical protein
VGNAETTVQTSIKPEIADSASNSVCHKEGRSLSIRRRLLPHGLFWLVLWPIFSLCFGAVWIRQDPLTSEIPLSAAFLGAFATTVKLLPEFLVCALLLTAVTITVFTVVFGPVTRRVTLLFEPMLAFGAFSFGLSLAYPIVLNHPYINVSNLLGSMKFVYAYPVMHAVLVLFAFFVVRRSRKGWLLGPVVVTVLAAFAWGTTFLPVGYSSAAAGENGVAIIGIDSLAAEDASVLREWSNAKGGAFYEYAVTPGLLTNSVWPSIVMHRPVSVTGTILTYQMPDWSRSPYNLVREAKQQGFETWSLFDDQFTTYVGSVGDFDQDRSGPMGWFQLGSTNVKNASVLLPAMLPLLPRIPFSRTPRNHAGTYTFDLRSEVHEILTAKSDSGKPTFVAAHLDYLHLPSYPRWSDLTSEQRRDLLYARAESARDFSLHWQYPPVPGDTIQLYRWKREHIQQVIIEELQRTGYLDPRKKNKLAVLSDHGERVDVTNDNFGQERYFRVLLITFNAREKDPKAPISLIEVPVLLGFDDSTQPITSEPVVEYTNFEGLTEWFDSLKSAKIDKSGQLLLRPEVVERMMPRLKAYHPRAALTSSSN